MANNFLAFPVIIAIIAFLTISFLRESGMLTRKKLLNKEKAQRGATVEKVEPVVLGSKRTKHYEIQVTFSDGTSYRDVCNITSPGYMQYTIRLDQKKVKEVVAAAVAAHEQAVAAKG